MRYSFRHLASGRGPTAALYRPNTNTHPVIHTAEQAFASQAHQLHDVAERRHGQDDTLVDLWRPADL